MEIEPITEQSRSFFDDAMRQVVDYDPVKGHIRISNLSSAADQLFYLEIEYRMACASILSGKLQAGALDLIGVTPPQDSRNIFYWAKELSSEEQLKLVKTRLEAPEFLKYYNFYVHERENAKVWGQAMLDLALIEIKKAPQITYPHFQTIMDSASKSLAFYLSDISCFSNDGINILAQMRNKFETNANMYYEMLENLSYFNLDKDYLMHNWKLTNNLPKIYEEIVNDATVTSTRFLKVFVHLKDIELTIDKLKDLKNIFNLKRIDFSNTDRFRPFYSSCPEYMEITNFLTTLIETGLIQRFVPVDVNNK